MKILMAGSRFHSNLYGRMDAVMWGTCGVEAACVYALHCKCNHACDAVCLTGVPRSQQTPPSWDPTVGLYLGTYDDSRGVGVSYERGTHVRGQYAYTPYRKALRPAQDLIGVKVDAMGTYALECKCNHTCDAVLIRGSICLFYFSARTFTRTLHFY